jgi:integrase
LETLEGNVIQPVVALTLFYGMRRSEILGLKWSAINLEENTLEVKATVVRFSKVVEKERTKNNASHRTYPIIPDVRDILLHLKLEQDRNRKLFSSEYHDNDYVFTWQDGRPFAPDYITKKFSKTLKQNNLPHIRYHDLRHTTASLLLAQGFQLKEIQEWLGHSDIKMTANIYGHLDFDSKKKVANGMGSLLEVSAPNETCC